jgi:DNA-binding NarL/FixJ family response regulator
MIRDRLRILIADDHRILTDTLAASLRDHFDVIGTFSNGRELLAALEQQKSDAVVLDISMPEMNGIEAAKRISARYPKLPIVFLTMHRERPYVEEALRAGATGYVLKQQAAADLVKAIQLAVRGEPYMSGSVWQPEQLPPQSKEEVLTARQREVLQLIAEGKANKEIAAILNISMKTVEFHKAGLMDRLGLRTTAELTRWAIEHQIAGA